MTKSSSGLRPKRSVHIASPEALALDRAVMSVMLGSPPGAVAAEVGCSVPVLMRRVKARRRQLRQSVRAERPAAVALPAAPESTRLCPTPAPRPRRDRAAARSADRLWTADRPVTPENTALVEAAYRRAAVDYSGRPIRSAPPPRIAPAIPADAPDAAIIDQALRRAYADLLGAR